MLRRLKRLFRLILAPEPEVVYLPTVRQAEARRALPPPPRRRRR